jgi:hypothetical protein
MDWMKGCHFKDVTEIHVTLKTALQEVVHGVFQKCFKQLYESWQMCAAQGHNFLRQLYLKAS